MHAISIGEVLWDVFPDRKTFGGAPLNFAVNLRRLGDDVTLISAVGDDQRGRLALKCIEEAGLSVKFVQSIKGAETGAALISFTADGETHFEIPRPAAFDATGLSPAGIPRR